MARLSFILDPSQLLDGLERARAALRGAETDFDRAAGAADEAQDSVDRLGDEADQAGDQADRAGRGFLDFARDVGRMATDADAARRVVGDLGRGVTTTGGAFTTLRDRVLSVQGVLTGLASAGVVTGFFNLADAATEVDNKLALVTESASEQVRVQQQLFGIAQDTAVGLESIVSLYSRLTRSSGELGVAQEEVTTATQTVARALAVQGTNAESARGGLLQLSQAIAGGTVRAEEFNSILENTPRIAALVAENIDEAGGSIGRLRQLVLDGALSSRELFDALVAGADDIAVEFEKAELTVSQALTQLRNQFLRTVGVADDAAESSGALVDAIQDITDAVGSQGFQDGITLFAEGLALIARNLDTVLIGLSALAGAFAGAALGPAGAAIGALAGATGALAVSFDDARESVLPFREETVETGVSVEQLDRRAASLETQLANLEGSSDGATRAAGDLKTSSGEAAEILALEQEAATLTAEALGKLAEARRFSLVQDDFQSAVADLRADFESGLLDPDTAVQTSILIERYSDAAQRAGTFTEELAQEAAALRAEAAELQSRIAELAAETGGGSGGGGGGYAGAAEDAAEATRTAVEEMNLAQVVFRDAALGAREIRDGSEEAARGLDNFREAGESIGDGLIANAFEDIQDSITDLIDDGLDGSIDSAEEWGDRILDIVRRTAANIASERIVVPVVANIAGALGFGGSGVGGAAQAALGGNSGGGLGGIDFGQLGDIANLGGGLLNGGLLSSGLGADLAFSSFGTSGIGEALGFSTTLTLPNGAAVGTVPTPGGIGPTAISGATSVAGIGAGILGNYLAGLIDPNLNPTGQFIGGTAGGLAGSFGGAALGAALAGGAGVGSGAAAGAAAGSVVPGIGTVIGALIGTLAGALAGGQFGPKPPSEAAGFVNRLDLSEGPENASIVPRGVFDPDGESTPETRRAAQAVSDAGVSTLSALTRATGVASPFPSVVGDFSLRDGAILRLESGDPEGVGRRDIAVADELEASAAAFRAFVNNTEELAPEIESALRGALAGIDFDDVVKEDVEQLNRTIGAVDIFGRVQEQLEALDAEPVNQLRQAFTSTNNQLNRWRERLEEAGLPLEEINELQERTNEALEEGFISGLERTNRALKGEEFKDNILGLVNQFEQGFLAADLKVAEFSPEFGERAAGLVTENLQLALDDQLQNLDLGQLESLREFIEGQSDGSQRFVVALEGIDAAIADFSTGAAGAADAIADATPKLDGLREAAQELAGVRVNFERIFGEADLATRAVAAGAFNEDAIAFIEGIGDGIEAFSDEAAALGEDLLAIVGDADEASFYLTELDASLIDVQESTEDATRAVGGTAQAVRELSPAFDGLRDATQKFFALRTSFEGIFGEATTAERGAAAGVFDPELIAAIEALPSGVEAFSDEAARLGNELLALADNEAEARFAFGELNSRLIDVSETTEEAADITGRAAEELARRISALRDFEEQVISRVDGEDAARAFRLTTAGLGSLIDEVEGIEAATSLSRARESLQDFQLLLEGGGLSAEQIALAGREALAAFDEAAASLQQGGQDVARQSFEAIQRDLSSAFTGIFSDLDGLISDFSEGARDQAQESIAAVARAYDEALRDVEARLSDATRATTTASELLSSLALETANPIDTADILTGEFRRIAAISSSGRSEDVSALASITPRFLDAIAEITPRGTLGFTEAVEEARAAAGEAREAADARRAEAEAERSRLLANEERARQRAIELAERQVDEIGSLRDDLRELLTSLRAQAGQDAQALSALLGQIAEEIRTGNLALEDVETRIRELAEAA